MRKGAAYTWTFTVFKNVLPFDYSSHKNNITATLLDNIFINSLDSFCAGGVLFSDVSDHLPVFTFLSEKMSKTKRHGSLIEKNRLLTW